MTNRYITTDQGSLSTGHGDNTFVAAGVTISGRIDMRGNGGGSQTITLYGTVFDSIDDYYGPSSGNDQIFIGATGSINTYWFGAVILGGGGHTIVNAGTISSMSYGNAVYIWGGVGAHQDERNVITNTGTISSVSLHPERGFTDATVYLANNAAGNTINNAGSILSSTGYAVALGPGKDVVTNTGYIQGGVFLGSGDDRFDGRQGHVSGPVFGYDGNDTLYGGRGDDTLVGGNGNDTYVLDDPGDVVDENHATWGGGGNDTIRASFSFDLSGEQVSGTIETLWLTGTADLNAWGTAGAEFIGGNSGDNKLAGLGGNDRLRGAAGDDRLLGGDGNDDLAGGVGSDLLYGGNGHDLLNGGLDGDAMLGGAGNDIYYVDDRDDIVNESLTGSSGTDLVRSSLSANLSDTLHFKGRVENLTLSGSAALNGTGNSLANTLLGNAATNLLDGRGGNDRLTGGGGADQFRFTTAPSATANKDTITDFVHGVDKIGLENAVFRSLTHVGTLASANFAINTAKDANDFVVYNTSTGTLYYDADGSGAGAAVQVAVLSGVPGLTQADFYVL